MIIDIFKDKQLWEDLDKHTETLTNLVNDYDFEKEDTSPWFNPIRFREYPLTTDIGGALNTNPLPQDSKYKLLLYCANYPAVCVINKLFDKDILIEDYACGATYFSYYMSKLGFNKYSLFDNFSQVNRELFDKVVNYSKITFTLNDSTQKPDVVNIVGYPWYEKEILDAELFCIYPCDNMFKTVIHTLTKKGYIELCRDSDYTQLFYCKHERQAEWQKKLSLLE